MRKRRSGSTPVTLDQREHTRALAKSSAWRDSASDASAPLDERRFLTPEWEARVPGFANRLALRIEEVAAATGLSASLVRALIREGELPAAKVRTVPLVLVADLLLYLDRRRVDPAADADRIATELEASLRQKEV